MARPRHLSFIARALAAGLLATLPGSARGAPVAPDAAQVHAAAVDIVIGYRLCAHAYPDFVKSAAPAWAEFRQRYPAAWSDGMRRPGIEAMADRHPALSDEVELELVSQCADLVAPGGFDPTRRPDPRLATPDGALAALEDAIRRNDRPRLLTVLMGEARFSVCNAYDTDRDGHRALLARVQATRAALAAAGAPEVSTGVVRGPAAAPTLLLENIRGEWRVGHL